VVCPDHQRQLLRFKPDRLGGQTSPERSPHDLEAFGPQALEIEDVDESFARVAKQLIIIRRELNGAEKVGSSLRI
jgi:hypothetical protein